MPEILSHIGNLDLLKRPKTAFLCSSKTTSRDILKSFDWATSVPKDSCIISGFQTKLEKDVLQLLLKRHIPVIIVLARRMYKSLPVEIQSAIDGNEVTSNHQANVPETLPNFAQGFGHLCPELSVNSTHVLGRRCSRSWA